MTGATLAWRLLRGANAFAAGSCAVLSRVQPGRCWGANAPLLAGVLPGGAARLPAAPQDWCFLAQALVRHAHEALELPPPAVVIEAEDLLVWRILDLPEAPRVFGAAVGWLRTAEERPMADTAELEQGLAALRRSQAADGTSWTLRCLAEAAERRPLPWQIEDSHARTLQFGEGRRRLLFRGAFTSQTSQMATKLARDKAATSRLLAAYGLPVPAQRVVRDAEEAWAAAVGIGLPVVVKPQRGARGQGVTVHLTGEVAVRQAYQAAAAFPGGVVVERFLSGRSYRVLVAGDRVVSVLEQEPASVVGDGSRSVAALVEAENRRREAVAGLYPIVADAESVALLADEGETLESVPARGRRLVLKRIPTRPQGGILTDVTASLHPDNARLLLRACRLVGVDLTGLDLIATDIARPFDAAAGIHEINAAPGLEGHLRYAPPAFADNLVAALCGATAARLPAALILGAGEILDAAALAAADALRQGVAPAVALVTSGGASIDGRPLPPLGRQTAPGDLAANYRRVARDPSVGLALVALDAATLCNRGFGASVFDLVLADDALRPRAGDLAHLLRHATRPGEPWAFLPFDRPAMTDRAGWREALASLARLASDGPPRRS